MLSTALTTNTSKVKTALNSISMFLLPRPAPECIHPAAYSPMQAQTLPNSPNAATPASEHGL